MEWLAQRGDHPGKDAGYGAGQPGAESGNCQGYKDEHDGVFHGCYAFFVLLHPGKKHLDFVHDVFSSFPIPMPP
jgi:hypothetical protein